MGKKQRRATFNEIVESATFASDSIPSPPLRPGRVNEGGVLVSPEGATFDCIASVEVETVPTLLQDGARLVFDDCGCGGAYCAPRWIGIEESRTFAKKRPRRRRRSEGPSWIDHWRGTGGDIVLMHGEFVWDGG